MKSDEAKKIAETALKSLSEELARGKSERLIRYLALLAKFHRYSFGNVLLIAFQRPDATHVAGFHRWLELGRYVKKGERGIAIFAPMILKAKPQANDETAGEGEQPSTPALIRRYRVVHVFDVSQTDGKPLPEPARVAGDPAIHTDRLIAFIAAKGIALEPGQLPPGCLGISCGGRITIRDGLDAAETFSVLVHELGHELLHHAAERPSSKTVRETEAEAIAHVVCTAIGLECGTASSDYIALYQGTPETLAASLDRIQQTAAEIIAAVLSSPAPAPAITVAKTKQAEAAR